MRPFDLFRAGSVADALGAAGATKPFKAAGIDLLDRLKERVESPATLVDVHGLDELRGVTVTEDTVRIGALTTLSQLAEATELAGTHFDGLRDAAGEAATPQIRNRATVGGNLVQQTRCPYYRSAAFECAHSHEGEPCLARDGEHRYHAILGTVDCVRVHPSNLAPALIALDATVETQRTGGTRRLSVPALYPQLPMARSSEHVLAEDELIVAIHLPRPTGNGQRRSAYRESREKQSFDWPTTAAATWLHTDGAKIIDARICLGAVGPNPVPAEAAAKALIGNAPTVDRFVEVAKQAYAAAQPLTGNGYKVTVGQAVLVDALCAAAGIER